MLLHITLIRFDQKEVKAINITFFMYNIYLLHLLCCVQPCSTTRSVLLRGAIYLRMIIFVCHARRWSDGVL